MSNTSFNPGVAAAQRANPGAKIVGRPHPGGGPGAKLSLEEVARRIREGRNDPRVVAWARRAIHAAGGPRDSRGKAQAILDALRAQTSYVADPVGTEMMSSAAEILCLDDKGFCFRGGDCDDRCIAFASATLGVGVPTRIIGQCFNNEAVPSHVLCTVYDDVWKQWLHVDPSTDKPVGEWIMGTKEIEVDPMATTEIQGLAGGGDFVGVGRDPHAHGLGDTPVPTYASSGMAWLGVALAAAAIGGLAYAMTQTKQEKIDRVATALANGRIAVLDDRTENYLGDFATRTEARDWAANRALATGRGAFIVGTKTVKGVGYVRHTIHSGRIPRPLASTR